MTEERLSATIGGGLDNRKSFLMDECRGIGGMHWRELGGITEGAAGRDLRGHRLGHFAGEETGWESVRLRLTKPFSFTPALTHPSLCVSSAHLRAAPAPEPAELFLPLAAGSGSGRPLAGSAPRADGGAERDTNQAVAVERQWGGMAQGGGKFQGSGDPSPENPAGPLACT